MSRVLFENAFDQKFNEGEYSTKVLNNNESESEKHKITNAVINKAFEEIARSEVYKDENLIKLYAAAKQSSSIRFGDVIEYYLNEVLEHLSEKFEKVYFGKLHDELGIEGEKFFVESEGGQKQIDLLYGIMEDRTVHIYYWEIKCSTNLDSEKAKKTREKISAIGEEIKSRIPDDQNINIHASGLAPLFGSKEAIPKDAEGAFAPYGKFWRTVPEGSEDPIDLLDSGKKVYKEYIKDELEQMV